MKKCNEQNGNIKNDVTGKFIDFIEKLIIFIILNALPEIRARLARIELTFCAQISQSHCVFAKKPKK